MKVTASTGDPFDYILLEAETLKEASDLVFVGQSQFIRDKDRISLASRLGGVALMIRLSPVNEHVSAEVNAAHDAEP